MSFRVDVISEDSFYENLVLGVTKLLGIYESWNIKKNFLMLKIFFYRSKSKSHKCYCGTSIARRQSGSFILGTASFFIAAG